MFHCKKLSLCLICLLLLLSYSFAHSQDLKMSETEKGVVQIGVQRDNGSFLPSAGTGFFLTEDGVIATAYHVYSSLLNALVESKGARLVAKRVGRNNKMTTVAPVELISSDEARDVALLKLHPKNDEHWKNVGGIVPLSLHRMKELNAGVPVTLIGYFGFNVFPVVVRGNLAGTSSFNVSQGKDVEEFLVSALMVPGQSGGPVLLDDGSVIGLINSIIPVMLPPPFNPQQPSHSGLVGVVKCEHIQRLLDMLKK